MQNPDNQLAHCGVCGALPEDPCVTRYGREALQVHWGRTARSERLRAEREAAAGVLRYLDEQRSEDLRILQGG